MKPGQVIYIIVEQFPREFHYLPDCGKTFGARNYPGFAVYR